NAYSAGAGYSPQDALVSPPTGICTILIYILAVTMVMLVLSPLAEALKRIRGRPFGRRAGRIRLIASVLGVARTALIWLLVTVIQEEPLFGSPGPCAYADFAVWLTMYGY